MSSASKPLYDCHVFYDNGDFKLWEKKVINEVFSVTGLAGRACLTGKQTITPYPSINDMLKDKNGKDTDVYKFDLEPNIGGAGEKQKLTKYGLDAFRKAVDAYPSIVAVYEKDNKLISAFFNNYLSADCKTTLQCYTEWINACNAPVTDNVAKWTLIKKLFSQGTRKLKHRKFREFLNLTQGDKSLPQFSEAVNDGFATMAANFASVAHPDHIAMDDLKQLVFLTGLDPIQYRFYLDKWYVDNPIGCLETADEIMAAVATYSREIIPEPSASQYAVSYVAHTPEIVHYPGTYRSVDGKVSCNGCGVPIPFSVSDNGVPRAKCPPCYRKYISERKPAKVSRAAKPGPVVPKLSQAGKTAARATVAATGGKSSLAPGGQSLRIHSDSEDDSEED